MTCSGGTAGLNVIMIEIRGHQTVKSKVIASRELMSMKFIFLVHLCSYLLKMFIGRVPIDLDNEAVALHL